MRGMGFIFLQWLHYCTVIIMQIYSINFYFILRTVCMLCKFVGIIARLVYIFCIATFWTITIARFCFGSRVLLYCRESMFELTFTQNNHLYRYRVNPVPKPKCQVHYGCRYSCINLYTLSSATQSVMYFFILVSASVLSLYCVVVVKPSLDFLQYSSR